MRQAKHKKTAAEGALWPLIRLEAQAAAEHDPVMGAFLRYFILDRSSLQEALMLRLVSRFGAEVLDKDVLLHSFSAVFAARPGAEAVLEADLRAVYARDAASCRYSDALLYFKGFHALQLHRIAHALWQQKRRDFAYALQSRSSAVFQTDIHPAAQIGKGVLLDHATGIVIGETAAVGDDVTMFHGVTIGSTGRAEAGDRHPKIGSGAFIGAGAKVLGNITIGSGARIAANSVVLKDVPPHSTAAGIPARIIGPAR